MDGLRGSEETTPFFILDDEQNAADAGISHNHLDEILSSPTETSLEYYEPEAVSNEIQAQTPVAVENGCLHVEFVNEEPSGELQLNEQQCDLSTYLDDLCSATDNQQSNLTLSGLLSIEGHYPISRDELLNDLCELSDELHNDIYSLANPEAEIIPGQDAVLELKQLDEQAILRLSDYVSPFTEFEEAMRGRIENKRKASSDIFQEFENYLSSPALSLSYQPNKISRTENGINAFSSIKSQNDGALKTESLVSPTPSVAIPEEPIEEAINGLSEKFNITVVIYQVAPHVGDELPYHCDFDGCGKKFSNSSNLLRHIRVHTKVKPFVCYYPGCGKSFSHKPVFQEHLMLHEGVKSFICDICNKGFGSKPNLQRHYRIHTGEKPFQCRCGKAFSQSSNMKQHTKRCPFTRDNLLPSPETAGEVLGNRSE